MTIHKPTCAMFYLVYPPPCCDCGAASPNPPRDSSYREAYPPPASPEIAKLRDLRELADTIQHRFRTAQEAAAWLREQAASPAASAGEEPKRAEGPEVVRQTTAEGLRHLANSSKEHWYSDVFLEAASALDTVHRELEEARAEIERLQADHATEIELRSGVQLASSKEIARLRAREAKALAIANDCDSGTARDIRKLLDSK